jgi:hypothetical protein
MHLQGMQVDYRDLTADHVRELGLSPAHLAFLRYKKAKDEVWKYKMASQVTESNFAPLGPEMRPAMVELRKALGELRYHTIQYEYSNAGGSAATPEKVVEAPEEFNWRTTAITPSLEEFTAMAQEYMANDEESGRLHDVLQALDIDTEREKQQFRDAQMKILRDLRASMGPPEFIPQNMWKE